MKIFQISLLLLSFTAFSQQISKVDFKTLDAVVQPDAETKSVSGSCKFTFEVKSAIDTISIDAVDMVFSEVQINSKTVDFQTKNNKLQLYKGYKKGKNTVTFKYSAKPKQTLYFTGSGDNLQIWSQGQGKETSHWLPSFNDTNEKLIFNTTIIFDQKFEVVSNGLLTNKKQIGSKTGWNYTMSDPMSSYLVMIAIGIFEQKTEISQSGVPLQYYFRPQDADKFEPTYRHTKKIFDFFEREIQIPYPWKIYKQVPVTDFLYAGMENTSATTFSQDFVVDSIGFNDRNYINVNAHELAHQWFGNYITAVSGKHHWLQEGFATYYALLAEREVFGEDHFAFELYEMAEVIQRASATDTIPILNPKASSLTFYKKGAWALHALQYEVGYDAFRKAVGNYLEKYAFKNVDTDQFLAEVKKVAKFDEHAFRQNWLENPKFNVSQALEILNRNQSVKFYLGVLALSETPFEQKRPQFEEILNSDAHFLIKQEVVYQLQDVPFEQKSELLTLALNSNHVRIRQAVARSTSEIPPQFQSQFESLLSDPSYITREIAVGKLYAAFPEKRISLLNRTDSQIGFNDKNLRIQWLTLALITPDFNDDKKVNYYDELLSYGSDAYESSIRINAIRNLLYINGNDTNVLDLLISPLTHHKWQFSRYARDTIRELIKKDNFRKYFISLLPELNQAEQFQLNRLLNP